VIRFIETPVFTRRSVELLTESEYAALQSALVLRPEIGDLIPGTGGLRRLRWLQSRRGKGKRGGVRVVYFWYVEEGLIYLLIAYSKDEKDDLSASEKRILRSLVEQEFK
jgi:mRNA-degrading endonuclease RelE of RelBE toxin-antitoxin system